MVTYVDVLGNILAPGQQAPINRTAPPKAGSRSITDVSARELDGVLETASIDWIQTAIEVEEAAETPRKTVLRRLRAAAETTSGDGVITSTSGPAKSQEK